MESKKNAKIVIIGAGLGGMAAAIACAAKGHTVSVFEKNNTIGGKLNVLQKEGFSFDLGPSILTLTHIFKDLFNDAGKEFERYVPVVPLPLHWRNFFEDGSVVDLYEDRDKTAAYLDRLFPGAGKELRQFLAYSKKQYDMIDKHYFKDGLDTVKDILRRYFLPELILRLDFHKTMHASVSRFFKEPHLQDIFDYFIKYVGSSAYNAPGFMNLLPWIQFGYGLWYVQGGMYNLCRGMHKAMKELGVTIHCNSKVEAITTEDNRATGIIVEGNVPHQADIVISNMEVIPAYERLLTVNPSFLKSLEKFEPACSGLVVHLGTDIQYPSLAHHNFFYSKDQKHHFDLVFNKKMLPEDPTIYLVAPVRTDATVAPPGCDIIKILPHIPYMDEAHPYTESEYIDSIERVIGKLERMGLHDLRKHIVVRHQWTPLDIEKQYASNRGSIYGVVSDLKKNFAFKAPKRSGRFKNLYFVGGSVNPGGGMPMVTLCGHQVARCIERDGEES